MNAETKIVKYYLMYNEIYHLKAVKDISNVSLFISLMLEFMGFLVHKAKQILWIYESDILNK